MDDLKKYPKSYRKNIARLMYMFSIDAEKAYSMIKMTALMMDLDMDDEGIIYAILMDCGCGEGECA